MYRRRYLTIAGGALALAGCAGTDPPDDGQETQPTDSATPSPTATSTPSATSSPTVSSTPETAPEILFANLVGEFKQYGDVREEKIESATAGDSILVGNRHRYYVHDGTLHVFEQADVWDDESSNHAGTRTREDEQVFDTSGYQLFESTLLFDTQGWGPGTYEASIRIRDEVTGTVSNEAVFTFELE